MKTYFFTMNQVHRRTFDRMAKVTGVVQAENEEQAYEKALALAGSDSRCNTEVTEINLEDGFAFTVYKSEM